ncbi:MAG: hypothetical protein IT162_01245 [Bryobacterales bacterium]|nr:hypothetical protein [Bryobacterales bacterium]
MSRGDAIIGRTIGFLFDRELRTDSERRELENLSDGAVQFLTRRMYENYLLDAPLLGRYLKTPEEEILLCLQVDNGYDSVNSKRWLEETNGAKVLDKIFQKFCGRSYQKTKDGPELTKLAIDTDRNLLKDVVSATEAMLNRVY